MIHTFEISYSTVIESEVLALMDAFGFPQQKVRKVIDFRPSKRKACVRQPIPRQYAGIGIKHAQMYREIDKQTGGAAYSFSLKLEPQVMLVHHRTIDLYRATNENNELLRHAFHAAMNNFIDDTSIPNITELDFWNCKRIDYTHNLVFGSSDDKQLFLDLSKKTSKYTRQREKRSIKGVDKYDQSTAEANRSSKVTFYDKQREIQDKREGMPEDEKERLMRAAENIVRYEVQCKYGKVMSIKKSFSFPSRRIMYYLDEGVAHKVLLDTYKETVGTGDFYYFYRAKKIIEASAYSTRKRHTLFDWMRFVAQSRSLYRARQLFLARGHRIKKTKIVVQGTAATFTQHIKDVEAIGLNPIMIPKDWGVKEFKNPIAQLR